MENGGNGHTLRMPVNIIKPKQIATLKRRFLSMFSLLIVQIVLSCSVVVLAFNLAFYLRAERERERGEGERGKERKRGRGGGDGERERVRILNTCIKNIEETYTLLLLLLS